MKATFQSKTITLVESAFCHVPQDGYQRLERLNVASKPDGTIEVDITPIEEFLKSGDVFDLHVIGTNRMSEIWRVSSGSRS